MIVGMHHVGISVPDLDEAVRFYREAFGFEGVFANEWDGDRPEADRVIGIEGTSTRVAMLRGSNVYLELWEYRRPEPAERDPGYSPADHGFAHICLEVTDIEAEWARLTEAGMTFTGPPADLGASSAVYGRDPFGNIIEVYEVPAGRGIEDLGR